MLYFLAKFNFELSSINHHVFYVTVLVWCWCFNSVFFISLTYILQYVLVFNLITNNIFILFNVIRMWSEWYWYYSCISLTRFSVVLLKVPSLLLQHCLKQDPFCLHLLLWHILTNFRSSWETYYKKFATRGFIINTPCTVFATALPCKTLINNFGHVYCGRY